MWELRKKSARGRISLRRISLVGTAMLMAMFALTSILAPKALAADATRDGDNVIYESRTFTPMTDAQRPSGIQRDVGGYVSLDETNKKAHFILTTDDPAKATTGQYVIYDFTPPANFSNPSPPVTVAIVEASPDEPTPADDDSASGCNGQFLQGIGWILCPVVNFLASGMDHLFDILSGFLVVQPARASEDNSLFKMWGIIRNLANIAFVIAFLVVIYSQVTSIGISTYGIKKIMPRLIIAAILVNISFWVCALAIDISNTLGYGIHSLFMSVFDSLNTSGAYQDLTWSNVATTVLSGTAVGALAAYGIYGALGATIPGLLMTLIPTLVGVLLSVLVALLVISVRQALITCLVIISPLAFVAFLLPNTEKYFTKWRELFLTLLLVYPIFSVVFGGAQLAGMAIIQNAGGSLSLIILGMAVQVAPVVVTPLLIKVSGSLVGKIAALANNPRQSVMNKTRTWAEGRAAEEKARVLAGAARNGRINRLSQSIDSRRRWHEGLRKEYETAADNRFTGSRRGVQLEEFRRRNANQKQRIDNRFAASETGQALELESRHLGVTKTNIETNMLNTQAGRELRRRMSDSEAYKQESENAFNRTESGQQARARRERADIDKTNTDTKFNRSSVGKQVDQARREAERTKQKVAADLEHEWHFRNLTDAGSQEREMKLRIATDRAADTKERVSAVYDDIKANKEGATIVGAVVGAARLQSLTDDAFAVAQDMSATATRKAMAARELSHQINKELLKNTEYQLDPAGNIMRDAAGNKIILSGREIDGVDIQTYATGIGKRKIMLASEVEKSRKGEDQESTAAFELMKHFNLSSSDFDKLATEANSTVTRTDSNNNEITFEFDDEAARAAAISWIAKNGAYGQKKKLALSGGQGGINESMSGFIQRELVSNGFGALAPWANDITIDEMGQGRIQTETDIRFHGFREIHEGRPKAESLAGANNTALNELYSVFNDRANDTTEWHEYLARNEDLIRRQRAGQPQAVVDAALDEFRQMIDRRFDVKYYNLIEETERILSDPQLRARTTAQSRAEMERAIAEYRGSQIGRQQAAYHARLQEAREHTAAGNPTQEDTDLLMEHARIYEK